MVIICKRYVYMDYWIMSSYRRISLFTRRRKKKAWLIIGSHGIHFLNYEKKNLWIGERKDMRTKNNGYMVARTESLFQVILHYTMWSSPGPNRPARARPLSSYCIRIWRRVGRKTNDGFVGLLFYAWTSLLYSGTRVAVTILLSSESLLPHICRIHPSPATWCRG